jgi:hypothetical protein
MTTLQFDALIALRGAGKYGVDLETILADMRKKRHRNLAIPELERAIRDIDDMRFATQYTSATGSTRWRITALGESALQEEGV